MLQEIMNEENAQEPVEIRTRVGCFAIPATGELSAYLPIFSMVFPIKADYDPVSNAFEYVGLSDLFDEIEKGAVLPGYIFIVEPGEDGAIIVKANKVEV